MLICIYYVGILFKSIKSTYQEKYTLEKGFKNSNFF